MSSELRDFFVKNSPNAYDLESFSGFTCPLVLPTGLLNYDLRLFKNADGTDHGLQYGTFHEILGQQGTLKTTMCMRYLAKHLKQDNSFAIWFDIEKAARVKYIRKNLRQNGFENATDEEINDLPFIVCPADNISEVEMEMSTLFERLRAIEAEQRRIKGNETKDAWELVPRVLIVLDSLATLSNQHDMKSFESSLSKAVKKAAKSKETTKDDEYNAKMGGHASELHLMFKYFLGPVAKYGIMFLFTNHYRSNLGFGMKKYNPAHDSATKYYISSRQDFSNYRASFDGKGKANGNETTTGQPLEIKWLKLREEGVMRQTGLDYYYESGFDEEQAFLDGLVTCGVLSVRAGVYKYNDLDYPEDLAEMLEPVIWSRKNNIKFTSDELNLIFKEDHILKEKLDRLARKIGQITEDEVDSDE